VLCLEALLTDVSKKFNYVGISSKNMQNTLTKTLRFSKKRYQGTCEVLSSIYFRSKTFFHSKAVRASFLLFGKCKSKSALFSGQSFVKSAAVKIARLCSVAIVNTVLLSNNTIK